MPLLSSLTRDSRPSVAAGDAAVAAGLDQSADLDHIRTLSFSCSLALTLRLSKPTCTQARLPRARRHQSAGAAVTRVTNLIYFFAPPCVDACSVCRVSTHTVRCVFSFESVLPTLRQKSDSSNSNNSKKMMLRCRHGVEDVCLCVSVARDLPLSLIRLLLILFRETLMSAYMNDVCVCSLLLHKYNMTSVSRSVR